MFLIVGMFYSFERCFTLFDLPLYSFPSVGVNRSGLAVLLDAASWVRSSEENFSCRRDFSLGVDMGSDSIPSKTLLDERINRGLVCVHMHSITQT